MQQAAAFKSQVGLPTDEDLSSWAHHHTVATTDDIVLKDALDGAPNLVSFIFSMEVTADLVRQSVAA